MARIEIVTSPANPLLKEIRRAAGRGTPTSTGLWIAEGFHLLDEALRTGLTIPTVLVSESAQAQVNGRAPDRLVVLNDKLFREFSTTETSQGVIALVQPPEWDIAELFRRESPVIVLDGIQDPGNAGTIVRAADAFGASGVIFAHGCVSPHHPKTLRAAAGSLFRVPFAAGLDFSFIRAALEQQNRTVYAAMPQSPGVRLINDVDLARNCAIIIGSEGRGVSPELLEIAEGVSIPTSNVESLNAGTAAAVLLYEAQRRR